MTVLSAQSIRRLCVTPHGAVLQGRAMITPFTERAVVNGKSYGLSACTYDCRIAEDLVLEPGQTALASTIERFCFPHNVCGAVLDKSTYARLFVSVFTTHFDPGFTGHATIELANHGSNTVIYAKGDPVCQFKFEWLDEPTELPYVGRKYSDQPARPVGPIDEETK